MFKQLSLFEEFDVEYNNYNYNNFNEYDYEILPSVMFGDTTIENLKISL